MSSDMSRAEHLGKKSVGVANSIVNFAVLTVVVALVCFSGFALWDFDQVQAAAASTNYSVYKPVPEAKSFDELILINDDVCAWIEVYGTHIDYPIVQGKDNVHYLNRNAEGKQSLSGSVFLDYRNARNFSDFNSILYGHHMDKQAMFGEIGEFAKKDYFEDRRYGMLFYEGKEHGLQFFAFLHIDAYDDAIFNPAIKDPGSAQAYLDMISAQAIHSRDIDVTVQDKIVLLNTCSSTTTNGRDVLIAKIYDETFDNPFATDDELTVSAASFLSDFWYNLPTLGKAIIVVTLCLLPLILLLTLKNRREDKVRKARLIMEVP